MIKKMYSLRDSKVGVYNAPFFQTSHGEAERNFTALVNDPKSTVYQFPEDFDLYYLGEFDDNTGKLKLLAAPEHQLKAVHLKREQPTYSAPSQV